MKKEELIWNYTMDTRERAIELSKRFNNKRYLDKQVRVIEAYRSNLNDLKIIMQNMYLVSEIEMERIQVLQANLKSIKEVKMFVNQYKKFGRWGFSPFIVGEVV